MYRQTTNTAIRGMIVATLTPFGRDGRVDADKIAAHVELLVEGGMPAVAPAGTTGEFLYLTEDERSLVVRETVKAAHGRLRVIAGVWSQSPEGVARLARGAEAAGADAIFLTPPIYYPASEEVVVRWYDNARRQTALPVFAYHIPQYAVNGVTASVLCRLIEGDIVQGIKDSTGIPDRISELLKTSAGRIAVYGASDSMALRARALGVDGFISALANIYPRTFSRIWNGDASAQAAIDRVRTAVKEYGGIGGLKSLLRLRGIDLGGTRLPYADLSAAEDRALHAAVAEAGDLT